MRLAKPRLVIAGLSGDSGKTLVALGLTRAFSSRGIRVAPFKKGPDYIDPAWLSAAAGIQARNLDTFITPREGIGTALGRSRDAGMILVEGNRGLYDGVDAAGTHSTAELAKMMGAPVLLVVDVTKMTRTAAALVKGCVELDPALNLAGVVLNQVATERQEGVIREALTAAGLPPVVGAIPRLKDDLLPGRHLGLVTVEDHPEREMALIRASEVVGSHVELETVMEIAGRAPAVELTEMPPVRDQASVRIAVFRDDAFSFYYPENLEALEELGAELVYVSPSGDWPREIDGLYIGGGFPEVHAGRLAEQRELMDQIQAAAREGMPIYAECGGLMYLAEELIVEGTSYPMAGVLDVVVEQTRRPQGHGYVVAEVDRPNPYFQEGTQLVGHEFHYSRVIESFEGPESCLILQRGRGLGAGRDGLVSGRVWASYLHLHALGTPAWARSLVDLADTYRVERQGMSGAWG
jgi:cobyrinic acid a,c-diamide synthase